jgi:hypothetical protein
MKHETIKELIEKLSHKPHQTADKEDAVAIILATMEHIRDNVLFELSSKNAVDEAIRELRDASVDN